MNKSVLIHLALAAVCSAPVALAAGVGELRAPAYPLVTIDPYISAWSMSDNLYEEEVKHWTETAMPLVGVAKVDGESYRFMGKELPKLSALIHTASGGEWTGRYTTSEPSADWYLRNYDDSSWKTGAGAFGSVPADEYNLRI